MHVRYKRLLWKLVHHLLFYERWCFRFPGVTYRREMSRISVSTRTHAWYNVTASLSLLARWGPVWFYAHNIGYVRRCFQPRMRKKCGPSGNTGARASDTLCNIKNLYNTGPRRCLRWTDKNSNYSDYCNKCIPFNVCVCVLCIIF